MNKFSMDHLVRVGGHEEKLSAVLLFLLSKKIMLYFQTPKKLIKTE